MICRCQNINQESLKIPRTIKKFFMDFMQTRIMKIKNRSSFAKKSTKIYSKIIGTCVHACTFVINIFSHFMRSHFFQAVQGFETKKNCIRQKSFEHFRPHLFYDFRKKKTVACSIALI